MCKEVRDWGCKVDAVDENVHIKDLLEWTALRCLGKIPLDDIIPEDQHSSAQGSFQGDMKESLAHLNRFF